MKFLDMNIRETSKQQHLFISTQLKNTLNKRDDNA